MKYIYCLVGDVELADGLPTGLGGREVYRVPFGGISALVDDVDPDLVVNNVQNAMIHHNVVQTALRLSPSVIPCRFGTMIADEGKVVSLLRTHYTSLEASLVKVRGKVEVGVEAIFNGTSATAVRQRKAEQKEENLATGEMYLLKKKERYEATRKLKEHAKRFSQELNETTSSLWTEVKEEEQFIDGKLLLNLCYLIDQEKLSSFYNTYEQLKKGWPDLKLLYTGPWPPYSFTLSIF